MSVSPRHTPRTVDLVSLPFTEDDWVRIAARFWPKVDQRGEDDCWPYTDHLINGYGRFFVGNVGGKKIVTGSNRVTFFLVHGELDPLLDVLHSCDNPPCCNWKHLSQGTHAENMADCDRKGRRNTPRGEDAGRAVLTEKQAKEVHMLYGQGGGRWSHRALGAQFGVSGVAIGYILSGRNWPHLKPPLEAK